MTVGRGKAIVTLKPGECIVGHHTSAEDLDWPASTFWDRLKRLGTMGMIEIKPDSHWSIVRVVNWQHYQLDAAMTRQATSPTTRHPTRQANESAKPNDPIDLFAGQPDDPAPNQEVTATQPTQSKNAKKANKEGRPVLNDVKEYARELDPATYPNAIGCVDEYFDYYQGNGWKTGPNAVKDWQATFRNWVRRQPKFDRDQSTVTSTPTRVD